jgi:hypothetical protein
MHLTNTPIYQKASDRHLSLINTYAQLEKNEQYQN